jgi:hypothetical protein
VNEAIIAESLEKLMENKLVKEKKAELEKKLESLKKKHEKVSVSYNTESSPLNIHTYIVFCQPS